MSAYWVRGSYRTAWHLASRGGYASCGTHLGYGQREHSTERPTWGTCARCAGKADRAAALAAARRADATASTQLWQGST